VGQLGNGSHIIKLNYVPGVLMDYYQIKKTMSCNNGNHRWKTGCSVRHWLALSPMSAFAILLCSTLPAPAQAQQLGQKQSTASGNLVTVYSISWPTPVSSVSADVEVCAGPTAPANTFAFPSFFQLHFADGGAIAPYGSKKQPTLERTPLKPKECVRGWLDFAVTSGQKPTVIRYHEMSGEKKGIEWSVK
jgi:hypothetical protein